MDKMALCMKRENIKRLGALILLLVMGVMPLSAQKAEHQDEWGNGKKRLDWWIGASLGVTHSLSENATSKDMFHNYPGVDLQVGTYFTRSFGMRVSMALNQQMGRPGRAQREGDPETYTNYRYQVLTGYLDAIIDLTTLFQPRKKYRPTFNMLMYVGGGGLESFDFDLKVMDWEYYPVNYFDKKYWAAHAGLMASYRFSPHWDWMLEGSYSVTDDRYDGVDSRVALSGFVKFHTGLVYHFYDRTQKNTRLTTQDHEGWEPSYTAKDREKVLQQQRKRLEKARKETAKRRAQHRKEVERHNKAARKANEQIRKEKQRRARQEAQARLYNEL